MTTNKGIMNINMYVYPTASNTIISPSAICHQFSDLIGFHQCSNIATNTGYLDFVPSQNERPRIRVELNENNGLWYHQPSSYTTTQDCDHIQINFLLEAAKY